MNWRLAGAATLTCALGIFANSDASTCSRSMPLSVESVKTSLEGDSIIALIEVVSTKEGCHGIGGCVSRDAWRRSYSVSTVKVVEQFNGESIDGKDLYSETVTTAGVRLAPGYQYLVQPRKIDGKFRIGLCSSRSIGYEEVKMELELLRSLVKER